MSRSSCESRHACWSMDEQIFREAYADIAAATNARISAANAAASAAVHAFFRQQNAGPPPLAFDPSTIGAIALWSQPVQAHGGAPPFGEGGR